MEDLKKILEQKRERLIGHIKDMRECLKDKHKVTEIGDVEFEDDTIPHIIEKEEVEIKEIEIAITRIDSGAYGVCESCHKNIPKARLKAIPSARLCIKCKMREESDMPIEEETDEEQHEIDNQE